MNRYVHKTVIPAFSGMTNKRGIIMKKNIDEIKKLRYGIIGCGRISKKHLQAVYSNKLLFLPVAFSDLKLELAEKIASEISDEFSGIKVKTYTSYEKMLDENMLDIVVVSTESGKHSEITIKALERGVNVICEKPMALSIDDCNKIIEAEKKYNRIVTVCLQNRFNSPVQKLKKAVETGKFGRIFHGQSSVRWNRNIDYYNQADWRCTWELDGGALMNQGSHAVDLLQWIMGGNVKSIYGVIKKFNSPREAEDFGAAIIEFDHGGVGIIEVSVDIYPKNLEEKLSIFGEKGSVVIGGVAVNCIETWRFEAEDISEIRNDPPNVYGFGHIQLYNDFYDAIIHNRKPYITSIDAKKSVEIILGIYQSMLTGKRIDSHINFDTKKMKGFFNA